MTDSMQQSITAEMFSSLLRFKRSIQRGDFSSFTKCF